MTDSIGPIWDQLDTTDPRYTKKQTSGAKLTSINGQYQFMKMTEVFGPCGDGWGFDILESDFINTGTIFDDDGVPMGEGRLHRMKVKLWYFPEEWTGTEPPSILGIGLTKFISKARYEGKPYVAIDDEYEKKSLTDALTNAMAKLGMAADVRMGMFDHEDYVHGLEDEIAIQEAGDKEAERVKQRHEFEDWYGRTLEVLKTTSSVRELELTFKASWPRVDRQGTADQKREFKGTKDVRFRELAPKKGEEL